MPDQKISQLPSLTSPSENDLLAIVNAGATKKITVADLLASVSGGGGFQSVTRSELADLKATATLSPGKYYLVTDLEEQILVFAVANNRLALDGHLFAKNADYQNIGDYSGVQPVTGIPAGNRRGIWQTTQGSLTSTSYVLLLGQGFQIGEVIQDTNDNSIKGVVVSVSGQADDISLKAITGQFGGGTVTLQGLTSGTVVEFTDLNINYTYFVELSEIVIWNGLHWQKKTDAVSFIEPPLDSLHYTQLFKGESNQGYVLEVDNVIYDTTDPGIANWLIRKRGDKRNNTVITSPEYNTTLGFSPLSVFQWGNNLCRDNSVDESYISNLNFMGTLAGNTLKQASIMNNNVTTPGGPSISNNRLAGGSSISLNDSCSINRCNLSSSSTINSNKLLTITLNNLEGSSINLNKSFNGGRILTNELSATASINSNFLYDTTSLIDRNLLCSSSIFQADLPQGASLRMCTLSSGANLTQFKFTIGKSFIRNVIIASNISGLEVTNNTFEKRLEPGFSNFEIELDIRSGETIGIDFINLQGGVFQVGEVVTSGFAGGTAVIIEVQPTFIIVNNLNGMFLGGYGIDNGLGVTATVSGEISPMDYPVTVPFTNGVGDITTFGDTVTDTVTGATGILVGVIINNSFFLLKDVVGEFGNGNPLVFGAGGTAQVNGNTIYSLIDIKPQNQFAGIFNLVSSKPLEKKYNLINPPPRHSFELRPTSLDLTLVHGSPNSFLRLAGGVNAELLSGNADWIRLEIRGVGNVYQIGGETY